MTTTTVADSLIFMAVDGNMFARAFEAAREDSEAIREATSDFSHVEGTIYVLTTDERSGYAIRPDGDLVFVFSLERGRGATIVADAIANGAETLDCFDGYLPTLYARHGFVEYAREDNWTPGGPDVVFMALPARLERIAS